jgi:hypothetical protein
MKTRVEAPIVDIRAAAGVGELPPSTQTIMQEMRAAAAVKEGRQRKQQERRDVFGTSTGSQPSNPWLANAFAKLLLKSPFRQSIGRKHSDYLDKLSEQFAKGDFAAALRNAIPFGGEATGPERTTLGTPGSRSSLTFTGTAGQAGSVPYGAEVTEMLTNMYRAAAADLEAQGRFHEAAYVLAELLNLPGQAVLMLERNKQWTTAAEVAIAFKLDNDLIVRFHWLSGNRAEAIALVRRHKNYSAVINRLQLNAPEEAVMLRAHWVTDLELAGDDVAAIEIGWEEPELRPLLTNAIRRVKEASGPNELSMYAYGLALDSGPTNNNSLNSDPSLVEASPVDELLERLERERHQPTETSAQSFGLFVETLDKIGPLTNEGADRRVVSEVVRHMARTQATAGYSLTTLKAGRSIRPRADRLLAVDYPRIAAMKTASRAASREAIDLPLIPRGTHRIIDAARTVDGAVLVALGEMGSQLLNEHGAVAAQWTVPTHAVVMSDSGTKALLITKRNEVIDVHRLDLRTRKLNRYGTLKTPQWADSFDGATWVIRMDQRASHGTVSNLGFLDMFADEPIVAWQELTGGEQLLTFDRTPEWLAAVAAISLGHHASHGLGTSHIVQMFRWSLPTMRLDRRYDLKPIQGSTVGVSPEPPVVFQEFAAASTTQSTGGTPWLFTQRPGQEVSSLAQVAQVTCSRDLAIVKGSPERLDVMETATRQVVAKGSGSTFGVGVGVRSQGTWMLLWDGEGRLCVIDRTRNLVSTAVSI